MPSRSSKAPLPEEPFCQSSTGPVPATLSGKPEEDLVEALSNRKVVPKSYAAAAKGCQETYPSCWDRSDPGCGAAWPPCSVPGGTGGTKSPGSQPEQMGWYQLKFLGRTSPLEWHDPPGSGHCWFEGQRGSCLMVDSHVHSGTWELCEGWPRGGWLRKVLNRWQPRGRKGRMRLLCLWWKNGMLGAWGFGELGLGTPGQNHSHF